MIAGGPNVRKSRETSSAPPWYKENVTNATCAGTECSIRSIGISRLNSFSLSPSNPLRSLEQYARVSAISVPCHTLRRVHVTRSVIAVHHFPPSGRAPYRLLHARSPMRWTSIHRGLTLRPIIRHHWCRSAHHSARVRRTHTPAVNWRAFRGPAGRRTGLAEASGAGPRTGTPWRARASRTPFGPTSRRRSLRRPGRSRRWLPGCCDWWRHEAARGGCGQMAPVGSGWREAH